MKSNEIEVNNLSTKRKLSKSRTKQLKPSKKILRLALKGMWFCGISVATLILGFSLFIGFGSTSTKDTNSLTKIDMVNAIIVSGFTLMAILVGCYSVLRKSDKTIDRWSRKSVIILAPLVLIIGFVSIASIQPESSLGDNSSKEQKESSAFVKEACEIDSTLRSVVANTLPIRSKSGSGTGFMIGEDGLVLTAQHVVGDDPAPVISLVNEKIKTEVIKSSAEYDLALLKITGDRSALGLAYKLQLIENYRLSEDAFAVGWPGNTFTAGSASVSKGIISRILTNKQLSLTEKEVPESLELVQFDAPVNPGNSGGPLVNKCGVVGVVIAISTSNIYNGLPRDEGISYAVSSKTIKYIFGLK